MECMYAIVGQVLDTYLVTGRELLLRHNSPIIARMRSLILSPHVRTCNLISRCVDEFLLLGESLKAIQTFQLLNCVPRTNALISSGSCIRCRGCIRILLYDITPFTICFSLLLNKDSTKTTLISTYKTCCMWSCE